MASVQEAAVLSVGMYRTSLSATALVVTVDTSLESAKVNIFTVRPSASRHSFTTFAWYTELGSPEQ